MAKYKCKLCGYIYDPAVGDPESGIGPGTPFEKATRRLDMSRLRGG